MIVFEIKKLIEQLIEFQMLKNERHRRYLKILAPVLATVLTITYVLSMIVKLLIFDGRRNVNKASITFGAIPTYAVMILIHWHFFINRERYYTLLNDMQQIVNDKCK